MASKNKIFKYKTVCDPFIKDVIGKMCNNSKVLSDKLPYMSERIWGEAKIDDFVLQKKLGNGTFGEVDLMVERNTGRKIPVTAIREMKLLSHLSHPNVLSIDKEDFDRPNLYMVTPYMDHDLNGLLLNKEVVITLPQKKCYIKQLLQGMEYLHKNGIMHRDIKPANLLIDNSGCLKVADFGLSRPEAENSKGYTLGVVTMWYRSPELLLGYTKYNTAVDMWSVGCVIAELLLGKALFPGVNELDQMECIFKICGTTDETNMPCLKEIETNDLLQGSTKYERCLKEYLSPFDPTLVDLIDNLLNLDPFNRFTATQGLAHPVFTTKPLPASPKDHDFAFRGVVPESRRGRNNQNDALLTPSIAENSINYRQKAGTSSLFDSIRNKLSGQRKPPPKQYVSPRRNHRHEEDSYRLQHHRELPRSEKKPHRDQHNGQHNEPQYSRSPNPHHSLVRSPVSFSLVQLPHPPPAFSNEPSTSNEPSSQIERPPSETTRNEYSHPDSGRPRYRDESREDSDNRYRDFPPNSRSRYSRENRDPLPRRSRYEGREYERSARERSPLRHPRDTRDTKDSYRYRGDIYDRRKNVRPGPESGMGGPPGPDPGYRGDYPVYSRERTYERNYRKGSRDERGSIGRGDSWTSSHEGGHHPPRYADEDDRGRSYHREPTGRPGYAPRPDNWPAQDSQSGGFARSYHRDNPEYFENNTEWEQGQITESGMWKPPRSEGPGSQDLEHWE